MCSRDNVAVFCLSVDMIKITTNYFRLGIIYVYIYIYTQSNPFKCLDSLVITLKKFNFFENIIFM